MVRKFLEESLFRKFSSTVYTMLEFLLRSEMLQKHTPANLCAHTNASSWMHTLLSSEENTFRKCSVGWNCMFDTDSIDQSLGMQLSFCCTPMEDAQRSEGCDLNPTQDKTQWCLKLTKIEIWPVHQSFSERVTIHFSDETLSYKQLSSCRVPGQDGSRCLPKNQKVVSSNPTHDKTQWCIRFEKHTDFKRRSS